MAILGDSSSVTGRALLENAARALRAQDLSGAEAFVRSALDAAPHDPEALHMLAAIASAAGRIADAERSLRQAIDHRPEFAPAHAELSSLLCRTGRAGEALDLLDREIARRPSSIWPLSIKAGVLSAERRAEEAIDVHEKLVALGPDVSVLWMNYGHNLQSLGHVARAVAAYRRSVALDPANGAAWWGLANLRTILLDADDSRAMEQALPRIADPFQKIQMLFALGKALGDQGRFEAAFACYRQANALRGAHVAYDPRAIEAGVRAHLSLAPSFFAGRSGGNDGDRSVIFIVGMPRSGSTLVEQILANHPMIEGMGELFELQEIAATVGSGSFQDLPRDLAKLGAEERHALGQAYLTAVRRHRRTDRPYFTDKMPANWRFIALIALILPNARIIDVRRTPLACCFSAFTTYFNRHTSVPASLDGLGRYYRQYADMADHMAAALPGRIYRLGYEQLVENSEAEVRSLLDHLGLPPDPACLRFHENRRPIYTPSAQQVRVPINRSGLESWRSYESWLWPLKQALGLEMT